MPDTITQTPRILEMVRDGVRLNDLQATAAYLWLYRNREEFDADGSLAARIDTYWKARPGRDPYCDFLARRDTCRSCADTYRYENLSICPDCFATYCPRHNGLCSCGHKPVG